MRIKGIIMDFDGLILDTETPAVQAWQAIFEQYGQAFPLNEWCKTLGSDYTKFDAVAILEETTHTNIDRAQINQTYRELEARFLSQQTILPGVIEVLLSAKKLGVKTGLASSSDPQWVYGHLHRLEIYNLFDCTHTAEDVQCLKPAPDLFTLTLLDLGLGPDEAIVFEDSPNGIRAAQAAGIYCIAVPNSVTRHLDTSFADEHLDSLAQITLAELLGRLNAK
jgi:HAD superfamily hydrolase (TIGR01509 family)